MRSTKDSVRSATSLLQPLLLALIATLVSGPTSPSSADEPEAMPAPGGIDAELLREAETAARLERELRAERKAAAEHERSKRSTEQDNALREQTQRARAEARAGESQLAEQQAIQEDLLWAVTGRGTPRAERLRAEVPSPELPNLDSTNPRIAAAAPADRVLPSEIFEAEKVEIPAGRWDNAKKLELIRRTLDADGDGKPELIRFVERRGEQMVRQEEDRNYDGIIDTWSTYEGGQISSRVIDSNDDGNPDVWESYRDGRVEARELDRDDDGVRDVFYRYRGDSLMEEKHDANNDGVTDLVIVYEERLRVRAEEDLDRDGRMDMWIRYTRQGGREEVARIERDRKGRGFADTFEFFSVEAGTAVLKRREEDMNGDGEIDIVSFYEGGKLRRRQVSNPDIVPM